MKHTLHITILSLLFYSSALFGQVTEEFQNFPITIDTETTILAKSVASGEIAANDLTFADGYHSPGFSFVMYAAYAEGDDIYFGGTSVYLGLTKINSIARYTGDNWLPMGSGFNGSVVHIERLNGVLYAGGGFTQTGSGSPMNRLARWNGTAWEQVGPGIDFFVYRFTEFQGDLYIGAGNGVYRWDGSTMEHILTTVGYVDALVVHNNQLYVGGPFTNTTQVSGLSYVARWDGSDWHAVGQGNFNAAVRALTVYNGDLVAGGSFATMSGEPMQFLARYNSGTWSALPNAPSFNFGGVLSLREADGTLYIGGNFGTNRGQHALKYTETDWSGIGFVSTTVWDFSPAVNGVVYLAGNFATNEISRLSYVGAYNGEQQIAVPGLPLALDGLGAGGEIYTVSARGSDAAITGFFGNAGPSSAYTIARRTASGWEGVSQINGGAEANYALGDGRFVFGGNFTSINNTPMNRITLFNGTDFEPMGSGFQDGFVIHANEFNGDIIATGTFTRSGDGATVLNPYSTMGWDSMETFR